MAWSMRPRSSPAASASTAWRRPLPISPIRKSKTRSASSPVGYDRFAPRGGIAMSDQQNVSAAKPFWRRGLAGLLDFLTVFFVGGYLIGVLTGNLTSEGFKLEGWPALLLFALTVLYFYLGLNKLDGTIWQRILKAR